MCVFAIVKTHLLYKDGELCKKKKEEEERGGTSERKKERSYYVQLCHTMSIVNRCLKL